MEIYIVDPRSVKLRPGHQPRNWIDRQKERLQQEGQIEPILLDPKGEWVSSRAWSYSEAQILAAIELGWETILVTY